MQIGKCPGQDSRMITASMHQCPQCGYLVEMFSDEQRLTCPKCKASVVRETAPSCIQWCASARQCLGEERWQALFGEQGQAGREPEKK
jgi:ribosomal protein S27AE